MSAFESPLDLGQLAILVEEYPSPDGPLDVEVVAVAEVVADVVGAGWSFATSEGSVIVGLLGEPSATLADGLVNHLTNGIGEVPTQVPAGSLPAPEGTTAIKATVPDGTGLVVYLGAGSTAPSSSVAAPGGGSAEPGLINLGMLREVPLEVTAELGRTKLPVAEILQLNVGSVVNLDRAAGAPVDVVVNGSLIARGEVVVIDDEYGVRITEILGRISDTL